MSLVIALAMVGAAGQVAAAAPVDATMVTSCYGTEPFWRLDINASRLRFEHLDEQAMTIANQGPRAAQGTQAAFVSLYQGRLLDNPSRFMNVIIQRAECSDGMSDDVHPFTALVLSGTTLYRGCCAR